MMAESPPPLEEIILDYISSNITCVCDVNEENSSHRYLYFKDKDAFFHQKLANQLLSFLDRKKKLDDLKLSLFRPEVLRLSQVCIHHGEVLSSKGLRVLRDHQLTSVTIRGLYRASVNDLIGCFSEWTLNNITSLNLSEAVFIPHNYASFKNDKLKGPFGPLSLSLYGVNCPFNSSTSTQTEETSNPVTHLYSSFNSSLPTIYVSLCTLKSLQVLNISRTKIVSHALNNICNDLKHLASLDISCCSKLDSIECLKLRKSTLKSLSMYNLKLLHMPETKEVLMELRELLHLDISECKHPTPDPLDRLITKCSTISDLIRNPDFLPLLQSFDISGHEEIEMYDVKEFLDHHDSVEFLGLMFTSASSDLSSYTRRGVSSDNIFTDVPYYFQTEVPLVTGESKPEHLTEALRRYSLRKEYVPKILFKIFSLTPGFDTPKPEIIKVIVSVMNKHKLELSIQLAGTACLYNLIKGQTGERIHPKVLQSVVNITLTAMNNFPGQHQLQKNCLLTLCCDRILHGVTFDKYWCTKLALDCLLTFSDPSTDRMAVAICSILAAKISTSQTALLGASTTYMKKLLSLVTKQMEEHAVGITLKFTLSALWNLTDESPTTCEVFLAENGLTLFMTLLKEFPEEVAVETKVLGLLNNIAEVSPLRSVLINVDFMIQLRNLLHSSHVDVSYFAAGIISHLACAGIDCWKHSGINQEELLDELMSAVLVWKQPKEEMVAYRSFEPFVPLLLCHDKHAVQLWAVWAVHHVTTRNSKRYCTMLVMEGVDDILRRLSNYPTSNSNVQKLALKVVEVLKENGYHKGRNHQL